MDPFMMAALALGAISTTFQAYGLYQQSRAAQREAEFRSKMARNNQIIAEREAEDIREQGEIAADAQRRKVNTLKGRQRAAMAEMGVELGDEGSAEDILADTALLGEFDIQTIRANAERAAYGREVEAENFGYQSDFYDTAAGEFDPIRTGVTSLLTGAGSVAAQWYQWRNTGPARRVQTTGTGGPTTASFSTSGWMG